MMKDVLDILVILFTIWFFIDLFYEKQNDRELLSLLLIFAGILFWGAGLGIMAIGR